MLCFAFNLTGLELLVTLSPQPLLYSSPKFRTKVLLSFNLGNYGEATVYSIIFIGD
jgi:hypothetical protein